MRDRLCTALEGFLESLLDAGVCWSNVVHDIPNSKSQISDKSQIFTLWNPAFGSFAQGEIPQGKYQMTETGLVRRRRIGHCYLFDICDLLLGIFSHSSTPKLLVIFTGKPLKISFC